MLAWNDQRIVLQPSGSGQALLILYLSEGEL